MHAAMAEAQYALAFTASAAILAASHRDLLHHSGFTHVLMDTARSWPGSPGARASAAGPGTSQSQFVL